jgi:hypothetical protein
MYIYVCVYIYTYTYIHTYIHTYIRIPPGGRRQWGRDVGQLIPYALGAHIRDSGEERPQPTPHQALRTTPCSSGAGWVALRTPVGERARRTWLSVSVASYGRKVQKSLNGMVTIDSAVSPGRSIVTRVRAATLMVDHLTHIHEHSQKSGP